MSQYADPNGLGIGGRALWEELIENVTTPDRQAVLLEVCRCKDRLDRFEAILSGDYHAWTSIRLDADGQPVELIIDKAATSAVATQNMFKQLMVVLRLPDELGKSARGARTSSGSYVPGGNVSSIERAKRRAQKSG